MTDADAALSAIESSLFAKLSTRKVQRSLIDPATAQEEELLAGVVCMVSVGGGGFVSYRGREGELGLIRLSLVGFLKVAEDTAQSAIETAELNLLNELLGWVQDPNGPVGMTVSPKAFRQSQQLEHPYGWLVLDVEVEF
ncbi:MAG: hypothetical protein JNK17_02105 [Hydrogenophaga sp.]|nr:hypothetical protein [Hydrogenophaga sp.]